jgi:hypothetical protein
MPDVSGGTRSILLSYSPIVAIIAEVRRMGNRRQKARTRSYCIEYEPILKTIDSISYKLYRHPKECREFLVELRCNPKHFLGHRQSNYAFQGKDRLC